MKRKLFVLTLLVCLYGYGVTAQTRIAVLEFNAGVKVDVSEVTGLSAMFNTHFSPSGYIVVERTRVSRVLEEQNFQGKNITEEQMAEIGKILNVPLIVIGDVNYTLGQYNIDVRVVNVQTGEIIAKDGAEWGKGNSYRETMKSLAERLAASISIGEKVDPVNLDREALVNQFIVKYRDYFKDKHIADVRNMLMKMDEIKFNEIMTNNQMVNPKKVLIKAALLGFVGADRFVLDDYGWAAVKICSDITIFGGAIWWIVDAFTAKNRARDYNYDYIKELYNVY